MSERTDTPPSGPTPDLAPVDTHGLQRVLGVPALFSTAYGNVGSSIYYALGLVAGYALGLTPVAFLIAGVIFIMTAITYAEGTARYPEAGGSSSFARHAFNEFVSFCTAWAQMLNYVITMAISAFFVPHYLAFIWEPLSGKNGSEWDIVGGCVIVLGLSLLNIVGVKETAALNIGLALADLGTQITLALLGLFLLLSPEILVANVIPSVAPEWSQFLIGITVAMIAYTGIETISNMAEETRDPVRSVPRAIGWVVAAVIGLYAILPVVALSALPVFRNDAGEYETKLGTEFAGDPFIGFVREFPISSHTLQVLLEGFVGMFAAVILIIATNAGIIGVSRLMYSMGQYQQVPGVMRRLHPKFVTPYVSISIFAIIACLLIIPGQETTLGNLYAFGAMLSFSIAHLSVIVMRWRDSTTELPWKGPMNVNIRGRSMPVFAMIGLFGTGAAWFVQVWLNSPERWIGLAWMVVGPVGYVAYRRSRGLGLLETVRAPIVIEAPSVDVSYNNILVPVLGRRLDTRAMVVACKLAAERGSTIVAVAVIEIPQALPLHAQIGDIEWHANQMLDYARAIGEEFGVPVVTRIVRARRAETAILEEAMRRESQVIVLGMHGRRIAGLNLLGRTAERVLKKAPTRVLLVREATPTEGSIL